MFKKKGQSITFANAPRIVLVFILLGIVLGAGLISLSSMRNANYDSVAEDTNFTASNSTYVSFAENDGVVECDDVIIYGQANALKTANFTIYECTAKLSATKPGNGASFKASYTASEETQSSDILDETLTGGTNLSLQLPTVGTMLGVGLILTVVIGVFAFFAQRGA